MEQVEEVVSFLQVQTSFEFIQLLREQVGALQHIAHFQMFLKDPFLDLQLNEVDRQQSVIVVSEESYLGLLIEENGGVYWGDEALARANRELNGSLVEIDGDFETLFPEVI